MISIKDQYFLRITLLLMKGCGQMSKEILYREIRNSGKTIEQLLAGFEGKLKHQFHKKQMLKFFPDSGITNIEEWDVAMLTGILLIIFKSTLQDEEKRAIKSIKYVRNEIYAHRQPSSMDQSDYEDTRNELEEAVKLLSSQFDIKMQEKYEKIVKECTDGLLDAASFEQVLEEVSNSAALLNEIITKQNEFCGTIKQEIQIEHAKIQKEIADQSAKQVTKQEIQTEHAKTREKIADRNAKLDTLYKKVEENEQFMIKILRDTHQIKLLILTKGKAQAPSDDSGFNDTASTSVTDTSTRPPSSLSDAYDEKVDELLSRPCKKMKKDSFEVPIGAHVIMQNLHNSGERVTSIGPLVLVSGTHSTCFITCFYAPFHKTVIIAGKTMNVIALVVPPHDHTVLVEVDNVRKSKELETGSSTVTAIREKHIAIAGSSTVSAKREKHIAGGTRVYKVGRFGLTEGIIKEPPFVTPETESEEQRYMYVETSPGSLRAPFAGSGDAGCPVFSHIEDKWNCIGILYGMTIGREELYVVRNIDDVIDQMQNSSGKQISLDHQTMALQISERLEKRTT